MNIRPIGNTLASNRVIHLDSVEIKVIQHTTWPQRLHIAYRRIRSFVLHTLLRRPVRPIDTRRLTIKDADGNVLFAAGPQVKVMECGISGRATGLKD